MSNIEDVDEKFCNNCQTYYIEACICPPPIIEEIEFQFTTTVKIKIHEWTFNSEYNDGCNYINECIKEWNWGSPRLGYKHLDTKFCHVAQNPLTKKWVLLYISDENTMY